MAENGILYTKVGKEVVMCYSKEKDINIQEGILRLNSYSFIQSENAENIVLPDSLETVGSCVFSSLNKCRKIVIGKNASEISPIFKVGNYVGTLEINSEN